MVADTIRKENLAVHPQAKRLMGGADMAKEMIDCYGVDVYVGEFANEHPGGSYILYQACGVGDMTNLFESVHMNTKVAQAKLAHLYAEQNPGKKLPWKRMKTDPFLDDIKSVVFEYYGRKYKLCDDVEGCICVLGMTCLLTWMFMRWLYGDLTICVPLGVVSVWMMGNAAHEGSHCSVSRNPHVNYFFNCLGLPFFWCPSSWTRQHCIQHHVHTNANEDTDLSHWPGTRLHHNQPFQSTYQNVKMFFKCAMGWLWMAIEAPFIFLTKNTLPDPLLYSTILELIVIFLCLLYPFLFFSWGKAFALALIPRVIGFYYFTVISHISHIQEVCQREQGSSWAATMVETSLDYSYDNLFVSILAGHLNLQSVHHLMPSVSQWKTRKIYPQLVAVMDKYDVKHQYVPTFWRAFWGWITYMRRLAKDM